MYCLEYLVSVRKNLVLAVVLQRCFYYWGKGPFLRNAYFSNFDCQKQVSVDSAGKLYLLFLPLGNTLPGNTRILPGILNFYSKCSYASSKKYLQIKFFYPVNHSFCHQLAEKLTSFLLVKGIFISTAEKK